MTELPFSSICSFRAACRSNMASHVALKRLRSRESYSTCKDGKPGCDAWQVWQIHMETHGHVSAWQVLGMERMAGTCGGWSSKEPYLKPDVVEHVEWHAGVRPHQIGCWHLRVLEGLGRVCRVRFVEVGRQWAHGSVPLDDGVNSFTQHPHR